MFDTGQGIVVVTTEWVDGRISRRKRQIDAFVALNEANCILTRAAVQRVCIRVAERPRKDQVVVVAAVKPVAALSAIKGVATVVAIQCVGHSIVAAV